MYSNKQLIDIRPSKGITGAQSNEHQRNWTEKAWASAVAHGNYDRTREHLNFEVARGGVIQPIDRSKCIPKRMAESLAARGIKDPNEGLSEPKYRTVVNIIIGGSRERMHQLAFGNQKVNLEHGADNSAITRKPEIERWAKDMYDFVCRKWGEDNVVGFYVHLEEMNPHIHCTLLPINAEGRFAFKKMFAGSDKYEFRKRTTELHNELAEVNAKWGLVRGDNKTLTGAKHRSTEEYRHELSQECSGLEQKVSSHNERLNRIYADIRLAERRVKGLTTMKERLESEIKSLESKEHDITEEIERKIASGKSDVADLQKQKAAVQAEIDKAKANLADKYIKLNTANTQLEDARAALADVEAQKSELSERARNAAETLSKTVNFHIMDWMMGTILKDLRQALPQMSDADRASLDGTLLMDIAERGETIFKVAGMLFAGYVDQATAITESCGGGGGCSSDWGRKDDEDDRRWAYRCMMQASRMLRPASRSRRR